MASPMSSVDVSGEYAPDMTSSPLTAMPRTNTSSGAWRMSHDPGTPSDLPVMGSSGSPQGHAKTDVGLLSHSDGQI